MVINRSKGGECSVVVIVLRILSMLCLLSLVECNSDEVRALLEFKKGIHSDPLGKIISTWNATAVATDSDLDSCPSSFHGVFCDVSSNSVVAIVLDTLNLSGELKFSTLIGLTMLRNLSLKGNNFTGRLVPQLGSMTNLQYLDLSGNSFIGRIPDRLHDLSNLNYLNLSHNHFSGGYPPGIHNLQQLRVLDVHANELWGDIGGLFFSQLSNVEFLDLSFNNFSGQLPIHPSFVSTLGNTIRHLNLSANLVGGYFFSQHTLILFQSLEVLDLGHNMIGGLLPSFHSLFNLRVLLLQNNYLYGQIPQELLSTIHIMELDLSGNGFSGTLTFLLYDNHPSLSNLVYFDFV